MNFTNIENVVYLLFDYFDVKSNKELADKLEISPQVLSNWKANKNGLTLLQKQLQSNNQLDSFVEFVKKQQNTQTIQTVSGGQNAQNVHGDMVGGDQIKSRKASADTFIINHSKEEENNCKDIDPATLNLFIESYEKAKEKDDIKGLRIHLMDY